MKIVESLNIMFNYLVFSIPGGLGGLAAFLLASKLEHYKNNKYLKKFLIEIFGAVITVPFLIMLFESSTLSINFRLAFAFLFGAAWARILQAIRGKATAIVEAALEKNRGD